MSEDEESYNDKLAGEIGIETFGQFPKYSASEKKALLGMEFTTKELLHGVENQPAKPAKKEISTPERLAKINENNDKKIKEALKSEDITLPLEG